MSRVNTHPASCNWLGSGSYTQETQINLRGSPSCTHTSSCSPRHHTAVKCINEADCVCVCVFVQSGGSDDTVMRYSSQYEERLDPFASFSKKVRETCLTAITSKHSFMPTCGPSSSCLFLSSGAPETIPEPQPLGQGHSQLGLFHTSTDTTDNPASGMQLLT